MNDRRRRRKRPRYEGKWRPWKGKGARGREEQGWRGRKWERSEHKTENKMRRRKVGDPRRKPQRWRSWKLLLPM